MGHAAQVPFTSGQALKADHVAIAKVVETRAEMRHGRLGDLIVTRVRFNIQRTLRGDLTGQSELVLEGGTFGGQTLEVSGVPKLRKGDEILVSLDDGPDGRIPHLMGGGVRVLKRADAGGRETHRYFATMSAKWKRMPVVYYVNPLNSDVPAHEALAAIQRAAETWSRSSRANFWFRYAGATRATEPSNNGKNEILFRNEVAPTGPLTTATTYSWWDADGTMVDSDLVFWDASFVFHAGSSRCKEGAYIQSVATHELGHVLGLKHSEVPGSTMAPTAPPCDRSAETLSLDDIAGLESLYPPIRFRF